MKKLKIVYLIALTLIISATIMSLAPIAKAASKNMLSDYVEAASEREETDLLGGVKLYKQQIKSYYDGITDPSNSKYEYVGSTVQWVDLPATSEEVKMVVWSQGTIHGFKSSRTTLTAKDWEEQHPGWIVVAAVNGDFFHINTTYEALGLMVQDTDVIRPFQHGPSSWEGESDGVIAWNQNNDLMIGYPTVSKTMSLELRNEAGEYTEIATIDVVNPKEIPSTGIALVTKDNRSKVNMTGATIYVGEYEFNRMSNENKAFVKGTIVEKKTNLGVELPGNGNFYLACKDGSLDSLVGMDSYVRCQYGLTGEWKGIESAIRYYCLLLKDGKHNFFQDSINGVKNDYGLAKNPRTVIGFKDDGSVVMMVSDGRGMDRDYAVGLSYFQIAEMMRIAGCSSVYQMDGGGSATLVARNSIGNLEVINRPSDGSERSIANAILMVMRDPGFKIDVKNSTRNSIVIARTVTPVADIVEDIKVTVDGKTKSMSEELLTIEGLEESTEYVVLIEYYLPDFRKTGRKIKGQVSFIAKTKDFIMPPCGIEITEINKNQITVSKRDLGYADWIQNVRIEISGNSYYMGSEDELVIDGLLDDTQYTFSFTYDVIEPGNPKVYKGEGEKQTIKTLAFNLPTFPNLEIVSKTKDEIKVAYEYDDEDDIAIEVYLVAYNEAGREISRQKVSRKRGNVTFTGLDIASGDIAFKILVIYNETPDAIFASEYFSEQVIAEKLVEETPTPEPTPAKKGCGKSSAEIVVATLSAASLVAFVLRKRNK